MTWTSSALVQLAMRAAAARDLAERHQSLVSDVATRTETEWLRFEACQMVVETGRRRRVIESGRMFPVSR